MDPVFEKYLNILCYTSGETPEAILGKSREARLCFWRHILWYYIHTKCGLGYYKLGKYAHRNHSTVVHGIHCAEDYLRFGCYKKEKLHYWEFLINIALDENSN